MATAGQDFGEYRHWLEAAGVDTSLVREVPGQVHGVVLLQHRPGQQPDRVLLHRRDGATPASCRSATPAPCDLAIISPNDPGAMLQYAEECRTLGIPVHLRSGPAVRADDRRPSCRDGIVGRGDRDLQRLRVRADPPEDGARRGGDARQRRPARRHQGRAGLLDRVARRPDRRAGRDAAPDRRSDRRRRRLPGRLHEGHGARRDAARCAAGSAAWRRPTRSSISAARATPTRGRSSAPGTRSTSARRAGNGVGEEFQFLPPAR